MGFIEQLIDEVTRMDLPNFIIVALIFYVPFYFSKKAQTLFFHLMYAGFGLYMLFTMEDVRIIYDTKMLVGLGLLVPQLTFLRWFIPYSIQTIKMMTSNTYYFFVTIYYKILRFINWVIAIPSLMKIFFTTFSFKNFNKKDDNYKQYDYSNQEEEKFYEGEQSSYEDNSYNNQEEKQEPKKEAPREAKKDYGEYSQFYSSNEYIVIGVSQTDDFKTIKKSYRVLVRIYHPDLNPDNIKQFTEITQNLNSAYEKLEKRHS